MSGWRLLLIVIASCLYTVTPLAANQGIDDPAQNQDNRPNIIFFLVDDLGWQDTSVAFGEPTGFQQHFRTPNLERLAASGVRFSNAYSCPVCTPTRASIMTGQNAARHRITNWTLHKDKDSSGKTDRLEAPREWRREGLQPGDPFLARILRDAGYTTIHCGKAHWGAIDTPGSDPLQLGFDINIAGHAAGAPGSYQGMKNFGNEADGQRKTPWGVPGLETYHGTETHLTDALTIEAAKALEAAVAKRKPFFLWMSHYAVHTPIEPHGRFLDAYTNRNFAGTEIKIEPKEAQYASMVAGIDASLGTLLQQLEKLGVAENTLIVFTSDNGGLSAHARQSTWQGTGANSHIWPLREGKGSAYDGGTRVPLVVSWAKTAIDSANQRNYPVAANHKCNVPMICEDHFP
ncbi:MAG: sulfatase-like hydrolase/transferase, partial [Pirellulaceae bacterium]